MFKFIVPAVIIFLVVLFWEKINDAIYKKFNVKINYIVLILSILILGVLFWLIHDIFLLVDLI